MRRTKKLALVSEEMAKKRKKMIKHHNRIKHIYEFWIQNCPEYAYTD
jgi:hypothetical protein